MERTPDSHPGERSGDQSAWGRVKWWWSGTGGRGYRDIWLIIITGMVVVAIQANADRVDDINKTRAENLATSCDKSNEIASSVNSLADTIQAIVISGSLLPGDKPIPAGSEPSAWTSIQEGPLSRQIEQIAPAFPDASERLEGAKTNAKLIENQKVESRDCSAEVQRIKSE